MHFPDKLKEGGREARLSCLAASSIVAIVATLTLACPAWIEPAAAAEDPFQSTLDLDYGRSIRMTSENPVDAIDRVPGFAIFRPQQDPPRAALEKDMVFPDLSATLVYDDVDLIRKRGPFTIEHYGTVSVLDVSTAAPPHLELRIAAEHTDRSVDFGDSSTFVDLSGDSWGWNGAVTYLLTPLFVPTLIVGGDSRYDHGNSLSALLIKGASASGWEWAATLGRRNPAIPLTLSLSGYDDLSIPIRMRRDFAELALRYHHGPWEGYWAGRWTRIRYPHVRPVGYSLGDSGSVARQEAGLSFERNRKERKTGYRASLDFYLGYGNHAFRSVNRKDGRFYPFSYQEAEQKSYSIRSDASAHHGKLEWGVYGGAAETEFDALRPEVAFNHYFWDRNGVLDSYQGSLLGVFNNETWLLNGAAYVALAGGGLWTGGSLLDFPFRLGLDYSHLILEANSHLTKRETTLLFAVDESRSDFTSPRIVADILSPEFRLGKSWGPWTLTGLASQSIPMQVKIGGKTAGGGGSTDTTVAPAKKNSGGTRFFVRLDLRIL